MEEYSLREMVHETIYEQIFAMTPAVAHHLLNPADIESLTDELMILIELTADTQAVKFKTNEGDAVDGSRLNKARLKRRPATRRASKSV